MEAKENKDWTMYKSTATQQQCIEIELIIPYN